jgi:hypothetical protein
MRQLRVHVHDEQLGDADRAWRLVTLLATALARRLSAPCQPAESAPQDVAAPGHQSGTTTHPNPESRGG